MKKNNNFLVKFFVVYGSSFLCVFILMIAAFGAGIVFSVVTGNTVRFPLDALTVLAGDIGGNVQGIEFHFKNTLWYILGLVPLAVTAVYMIISVIRRNRNEEE